VVVTFRPRHKRRLSLRLPKQLPPRGCVSVCWCYVTGYVSGEPLAVLEPIVVKKLLTECLLGFGSEFQSERATGMHYLFSGSSCGLRRKLWRAAAAKDVKPV
jgi:hypothetical protein